MTTDANRCSDWRALASCRLDGELDELQTARLERHLLTCATCSSWSREVAALAKLLHESEPVRPAWPFELRAHALRRRFARMVAVGATAASAAAVAAFAFGVQGSGISLSESAGARGATPPCASCMKKKEVIAAASPVAARAPIHVAHPLVEPQ